VPEGAGSCYGRAATGARAGAIKEGSRLMKAYNGLHCLIMGMLAGVMLVAVPANGQVNSWDYDYTGYSVPSASLETVLGTMVAELDADNTGYNFGDPLDPFRNLNVISRVYEAQQAVTIGTGVNGKLIELQPGDLTFAYTLDYTGQMSGTDNSPVVDFQLYQVIIDTVYSDPPISNPAPFMSLEHVLGAAYNTAPEFNTPVFEDYPEGVTGEQTDYVPYGYQFQTSEAEFSWTTGSEVQPGSMAMVFLFARDVTYMQIGVPDGTSGEGGNILGYGEVIKNFPVLVPIPEPTSILLLAMGGAHLVRRRGRQGAMQN